MVTIKKTFFTSIAAIAIFASCSGKKIPPAAEISITSSPDQAEVVYNGKKIGKTPFKIKTKSGTYLFGIEKTGHKPHYIKVIVADGEKKDLEIKLEEITSSVIIDSTPRGALVEVGGSQIGETPLILHNQTIGIHKAILKKPGMVQQEISWTVEDARPQLVKANLFTNMGSIKIDASPANAQVSIDGALKGKCPLTESLEQGEHKIVIEAPGYTKHEQVVVVERGKQLAITIALNVLPSVLKIDSEPQGAVIFINGRQYDKTPLSVPGLSPGKYIIRLERDGFDNASKEIDLAPGITSSVNLTLDTNMGGIDFVVNPPGVTIYLDGKQIGISSKGEDEKLSKVFPVRNLKNGEHTLLVSHKRAEPKQKTITVNVEKGKISRPQPINMWVTNAVIKPKVGENITVKLISENDKEIFYQPEIGVTLRFKKEEIKEIIMFKDEEE